MQGGHLDLVSLTERVIYSSGLEVPRGANPL
jgi:hypothetical protein